MPDLLTITQFRQQVGPIFSEVVQRHRPAVIRRGRDDLGMLAGLDEIWALVRDLPFTPQVMRGENSVSIWLPEFEIYGQGDSYAEAKEDLVGEARVYVHEYLAHADEYRHAPNRARHFGHVIKALLADVRDELTEAIFPPPPDAAALRTRARAA